MLVFEERGKPEYPEKNLSEQGENQQQTQPMYDTGGRQVLSPLRHPCSPFFCLTYMGVQQKNEQLRIITCLPHQEMVRENKNSSSSGKCQGILFWVRENWHFEEKSGKIEIVRLI